MWPDRRGVSETLSFLPTRPDIWCDRRLTRCHDSWGAWVSHCGRGQEKLLWHFSGQRGAIVRGSLREGCIFLILVWSCYVRLVAGSCEVACDTWGRRNDWLFEHQKVQYPCSVASWPQSGFGDASHVTKDHGQRWSHFSFWSWAHAALGKGCSIRSPTFFILESSSGVFSTSRKK